MAAVEREPPERDEIPFDENPPVDPSVPQVGNSRARFVTPTDEAEPPEDEASDEEEQADPGAEAAADEGRPEPRA